MTAEKNRTDLQEVTFREALKVWLRIGLLSFGGPAGQIALMHRELVEKRRWISETRFLHALNYCMLLPGPEAQQLAIYIGWLLHKTRGGIAAGTLFILPGACVILVLSMIYARFAQLPTMVAIFFGLKAAVLAIVIDALRRIGRRALKTRFLISVAVSAFLAIYVFNIPFPLIILGAALLGVLKQRITPTDRTAPEAEIAVTQTGSVVDQLFATGQLGHTEPNIVRSIRNVVVWCALWFAPILLLVMWQGTDSLFVQQGLFFGQTAVVTFGGAYAVLSYVGQRAVDQFAWLRPGEMLDGLALAETTPGPLILVLQFVAYMGAYRASGSLSPILSGTLGAAIALWTTFVPCFMWIFVGAPYIEALRHQKVLNAALASITAAVVGVIANLSLWFAIHALFGEVRSLHCGVINIAIPDISTLHVFAFILTAAALIAMLRFKISMSIVLAGCAVLGLVQSMY